MNSFNGRRAPNVSQYVANLNTIPSAHDMATQQADEFGLDDDLALFTNTEFYDFDLGETVEQPPVDYDSRLEERTRRGQAGGHKNNAKKLDFVNDFQFPGMTPFIPVDPSSAIPPPMPNAYPQPVTNYNSPTASSTAGPAPGEKRSYDASSLSPASENLEDASRLAAEEDKRRRNTAASARFRVKKKQREQALEKAAKELSDKTSALEARIGQLETENRWLRNLVTEKTGKDDVAELWRKFSTGDHAARSTEDRKKGVGTEAKATKEEVV